MAECGVSIVQHCTFTICKNCTCGFAAAMSVAANVNGMPAPKAPVRRDPVAAAAALEARFKDSMKILS